MSNWNLPTITSGYLDFVTEMNDKFVDAGTIGYGAPTNLPEHAMRFNRSTNIFEEWVGGGWIPKVIGIAGGGTGGSDPAAARAALGLGSMSVQNSNAVNITGGSITGVNLNADAITAGILALARGGTGASLALGAAGTVMLSNGSAVVFAPGTSITQLNAGALTVGTVPIPRMPANVAYKDQANQFTQRQYISNSGNPLDYPRITFRNVSGDVDKRVWEILNYSDTLSFWALNDAEGAIIANISFSRDGVINANGSGLFGLNGSYIDKGMVPAQFLGGGAPSAATFLRGDNQWVPMEAASGIPSGLIAIFNGGCPVGWTRFSALDNRFPLGSGGAGATGGSDTHGHGVSGTISGAGDHQHGVSIHIETGFNNSALNLTPTGASTSVAPNQHKHDVSFDGQSALAGAHGHNFTDGATNAANHIPPYYSVVFCQKN